MVDATREAGELRKNALLGPGSLHTEHMLYLNSESSDVALAGSQFLSELSEWRVAREYDTTFIRISLALISHRNLMGLILYVFPRKRDFRRNNTTLHNYSSFAQATSFLMFVATPVPRCLDSSHRILICSMTTHSVRCKPKEVQNYSYQSHHTTSHSGCCLLLALLRDATCFCAESLLGLQVVDPTA